MKKMRLFSLIGLFLVLFSVIGFTSGCSSNENISVPEIQKNVFVYDQDNIINDGTEKDLNSMLTDLKEKTNVEFIVMSVKSLSGYSIRDYSNEVFNKLHIGEDNNNGLLLLFSRSNNAVRIKASNGLKDILTTSKCSHILTNYFIPYRNNNEYTKATKLSIEAILNVLCAEYNISINGLDSSIQISTKSSISKSTEIIITTIFVVSLFIFFVFVTVYNHRSKRHNSRHSYLTFYDKNYRKFK